ncbi:MAG: Gldg family protein, partial [Gammaproteobacteria bacterium]
LYSPLGLVALAALMLATLFISNALFRGMRLDLTENNLYSVSPGTKNILRSIDEPLNLYYFFSDSVAGEATGLRLYAQRVREMLEEFALVAGDKVNLRVIDPLPFSEEEDQAAQFGLQAVPLQAGGDAIYFGLAGTNAIDTQIAIPFFQPDKEAFLEYDLAKFVHSLANPKRPVIGVLSTLPMTAQFNPATRRQEPGWMITEQIGQLFDLRVFDPTITSIEPGIDVLMVVHPKDLSPETTYAIDQFILGGGRALIFVDPFAEADQPVQDPNNPAAMFSAVRTSSMDQLFDTWGIEFDKSRFVADDKLALQLGGGPGGLIRHIGYLGMTGDALEQSDVVTGDLDTINLSYGGSLSLRDDASVTLQPLMQSSGDSAMLDISALTFLQDPNELRSNFSPDDQQHVIAARVQGSVSSAFTDAIPGDAETHIANSAEPINVIVVTDVDLLADRLWVRVQNFFGQRVPSAFANNGDFVFNALDNLTGNADLISIRGRATFRRPFDKVEELTRIADEKFRQKEESLQTELQQTEARLSELQASRDDSNALIMTAEQRAEIENFQDQKVRIRKELRQVRSDLDKDIRQLGGTLKAINILAVPALVIVFAIFMGARRAKRAAQQRGQQ